MSTAPTEKPKKRPPYFHTVVDVDVDISPRDLEAAGWRYVGGGEDDEIDAISYEDVIDVVHRWHDESHKGPWRWCSEQPCDELRGRVVA